MWTRQKHCEVGVLLTLQKHRKNQSDPRVTQKWLGQTDPKVTLDPIFELFLSHLGSLGGGTPQVTFESLLGHFNSFCVSVELAWRPFHNQNTDAPLLSEMLQTRYTPVNEIGPDRFLKSPRSGQPPERDQNEIGTRYEFAESGPIEGQDGVVVQDAPGFSLLACQVSWNTSKNEIHVWKTRLAWI